MVQGTGQGPVSDLVCLVEAGLKVYVLVVPHLNIVRHKSLGRSAT